MSSRRRETNIHDLLPAPRATQDLRIGCTMIQLSIASIAFVGVFLLQTVLCVWMEVINMRHLRRNADRIPNSLVGVIDPGRLASIASYTGDKSHLYLIRKIFMDAILLAMVVSGILPLMAGLPAGWESNYILGGILFFLTVGSIFFVVDLPFDYYQTFVLEEKYGFNRSDLKTWLLDHAKGILVSVVIMVALLVPVLWVIRTFPTYWWLAAFAIVSAAQLTILVLYPVLIAPFFNAFEPLQDEDLAGKTAALLERAGLKAGGVYRMDAAKRSSHSNAYFAGIGRTKRIVLFDTLLASHTHDEILAVLAHEIGHSKLGHVVRSYLYSQVVLLTGFFLTHALMNWDLLYRTFGFPASQSYVALFLVAVFLQRAAYLAGPFYSGISRRFERQADAFAAELQQTAEPLADALKKLASHNLQNLNPHPVYVWFNYPHPPIPERLSLLRKWSDTNVT